MERKIRFSAQCGGLCRTARDASDPLGLGLELPLVEHVGPGDRER